MKERRTGWVLVGLAVLILISANSCSVGTESIGMDRLIKLNISPPAPSRIIATDDYEVSYLNITITGPGNYQRNISWDPDTDPLTYYLEVEELGTYEITVEHVSEQNGETITAKESADFVIAPYAITVINIIPGAIGVLVIDDGSGVEEPPCFCEQLVGSWAGTVPFPEYFENPDGTGYFEWFNYEAVLTFNADGTAQIITTEEGADIWLEDKSFQGTYVCDCDENLVNGQWTHAWTYFDGVDGEFVEMTETYQDEIGEWVTETSYIDWSSAVEISPDGSEITMEVNFGPGSPSATWELTRQ